MIYKIVLSLIIVVFSLTIISAQEIKKQNDLYLYEGKTYTSKELSKILSSNELSLSKYEEYLLKKQFARDGYIAGTLLLAIGGGTTYYYSKNDCLEGHCIPGMMLGAGVGIIGFIIELFAMSNDIKSVKRLNRSIDIFNGDVESSTYSYKPQLQLASTSNGIGIVLNF